MIFITVGTTSFPFFRMNNILASVIRNRDEAETIVYQHGNTPVLSSEKNILLKPFLSFERVQQYLKESRIIICHGGPATIYQALSFNKKPYIFPRSSKFGEHVNDHQVFFSKFLENKGFVKTITTSTSVFSSSKKMLLNSFSHNDNTSQLCSYLDQILS